MSETPRIGVIGGSGLYAFADLTEAREIAVDTPFGGYKQSGLGRELGVTGFEEYLETKSYGLPA